MRDCQGERVAFKDGKLTAFGESVIEKTFGEYDDSEDETLRDRFAMAVITGLASWEPEQAAKQAYKLADAMMQERSEARKK
jgi:hypothetical protein